MDCKNVSPQCPVSDTIYGYYPSLPGNSLFAGVFGVCILAQVILGIKYRVRAYTILTILGCVGELVGYVGRIMMHSNPWNTAALSIQILLLIVSPSLLTAALYLTLKHLIQHFGPQYSRMKPRLYTVIFITCDAIGFFTQLIGGGIEAASNTSSLNNIGNIIMITGVVFQAITMSVCALLAIDFAVRLLKNPSEGHNSRRVPSPKGSRAFRFYLGCSITAFTTILIRCIYRIPEMAGGWGNSIMQNEAAFMVFDGAMVATAAILMTVGFPGPFFPAISSGAMARQKPTSSEDRLSLQDITAPTQKPA